ncbi:hypothetical protein FGG08_006555 [Glutinoglossum americanum]|uniref:Uncharacterized protein n=1 Tax=Glutinoglossum americanum TaxID=1670608 RepID=A0A9P8I739_9PEZI|nr:hypothetical protein FGG08_006555 [Glutinoglossum americanum]
MLTDYVIRAKLHEAERSCGAKLHEADAVDEMSPYIFELLGRPLEAFMKYIDVAVRSVFDMLQFTQSIVESASATLSIVATVIIIVQLGQLFIAGDPFRDMNTPKYIGKWSKYGRSPPLGFLPRRTIVRHPIFDIRLSNLERPSDAGIVGAHNIGGFRRKSSLAISVGSEKRISMGLRLVQSVRSNDFAWCSSLVSNKQRVEEPVPRASWAAFLNSFAIEDLSNFEGSQSRSSLLARDKDGHFELLDDEKILKGVPTMELTRLQLEFLMALSAFDRSTIRRSGSGTVRQYIGFTGTLVIEWAVGRDCTARFARHSRPVVELGGFLCPALSYYSATQALLNATGYFVLRHKFLGMERKYVYIAVDREDDRELPTDGEPVSHDHTLIHEYHSYKFRSLGGMDEEVTIINTRSKGVLSSPEARSLLVGITNEAANLRVKSLIPVSIRNFMTTIIRHDKAASRFIEDVNRLSLTAKAQIDDEIRSVGWVRRLRTAVPAVDTVLSLLTSNKVCNANEVQLFCDVLYAAQARGVIKFGDYPIQFMGEGGNGSVPSGSSKIVEHDWTELTDITAFLFSKWIHDACYADVNLFYDAPDLIQML